MAFMMINGGIAAPRVTWRRRGGGAAKHRCVARAWNCCAMHFFPFYSSLRLCVCVRYAACARGARHSLRARACARVFAARLACVLLCGVTLPDVWTFFYYYYDVARAIFARVSLCMFCAFCSSTNARFVRWRCARAGHGVAY